MNIVVTRVAAFLFLPLFALASCNFNVPDDPAGPCKTGEVEVGVAGPYILTVAVRQCQSGPISGFNDLSIVDCWGGRRLLIPGSAWGPKGSGMPYEFSYSFGAGDAIKAATMGKSLEDVLKAMGGKEPFSEITFLTPELDAICWRFSN